ncbi:MAG: L-2-amino-thiazoline-4-carboxylic acid hydrolase [Candidatus Ranarchaeia archaeon]
MIILVLDDQTQQLMQFFINRTQDHFKKQFLPDQAKAFSQKFIVRFQDLFKQNSHLLVGQFAQFHGINPIFVIALADTLQTLNFSKDELQTHVLTIYKAMLQGVMGNQAQTLKSSENAWQTFIDSTKAGNARLYDNDFFQMKTVEESPDRFGFDINRCLYVEIFQQNNRLDLAPILCAYDYLLSDNIADWVQFDRQETIANGDLRCTFRYRRVS